ncbi:MAG: pilus assembly protein N-terminal domain-containing protein [Vampirovibrionales bacterium]|nr:pilus assembly protein N-terminal domain-containing protein [Vampirovibrionales bacterium]
MPRMQHDVIKRALSVAMALSAAASLGGLALARDALQPLNPVETDAIARLAAAPDKAIAVTPDKAIPAMALQQTAEPVAGIETPAAMEISPSPLPTPPLAEEASRDRDLMPMPLPSAASVAPSYRADAGGPPAQESAQSPQSLAGNLTQLTVRKGRSQIIKFAQPIERLSIADPQLADVIPLAPDQLMINGKQRGVTSLIVWDERGQEGIFDLHIENDTAELMAAINEIAPNENIRVRVTDDSFIISGQASSSVVLDEIRRTAGAYGYRDQMFVDLTETPTPQVVLAVKIIQMNKQVARDLKTSFGAQGQDFSITRLQGPLDSKALELLGRASAGLAPGWDFGGRGLAGGLKRSLRTIQASNGSPGGVTSTFGISRNFETALDMLETNGKVSILAEPKLVATHGREASFLAGGEFPYVSGTDQNGSPILSFREYGVRLTFTPWMNIRTGLIEMKIAPEVSSLDSGNCIDITGGRVCGILKRTTNTTVQLHNDESLMISGILTREENNTFAKTPFVSDLPILGIFFKNGSYNKLNTELVVIVTPHVLDNNQDRGRYFESSAPGAKG